MRKELDSEEIKRMMEEILAADALELTRCPERNEEDLYIPYMMNDAVEYYIVLTQCKDFGDKKKDFPQGTTVEMVEKEDCTGIILRMPEGRFVTLWYQQAYSEKMFYQYHGIGHFWRSGQEQWRQLVYAIGTSYDKQEYLGEDACNPKEHELIHLMEFAPFRYWSPIKEDLDDRYEDSILGIQTMQRLCREAGDVSFLKELFFYQALCRIPFLSKKYLQKVYAMKLLKPQRINLYHHIVKKFELASMEYQPRKYSESQQKEMQQERECVIERLEEEGYRGEYPVFWKKKQCIVATEEHPFIIQSMDYDDFHFRIQFMVSESDIEIPNAGFFEGKGRIYKEFSEEMLI